MGTPKSNSQDFIFGKEETTENVIFLSWPVTTGRFRRSDTEKNSYLLLASASFLRIPSAVSPEPVGVKVETVALVTTRIWQHFPLILILVSPWLFKWMRGSSLLKNPSEFYMPSSDRSSQSRNFTSMSHRATHTVNLRLLSIPWCLGLVPPRFFPDVECFQVVYQTLSFCIRYLVSCSFTLWEGALQ